MKWFFVLNKHYFIDRRAKNCYSHPSTSTPMRLGKLHTGDIMPVIAEDQNGLWIGYHDMKSGKPLLALHAVDITDACLGAPNERKLLRYSEDYNGIMVQITSRDERTKSESSLTYNLSRFDSTEFKARQGAAFLSICSFADQLGTSEEQLLALIEEHKPPS